MAKQFSVFVNIGAKLNPSFVGAITAADGHVTRLARRLDSLNTRTATVFRSATAGLATAGKGLQEAGRSVTAKASAPLGLLGMAAGRTAFEFEKAGNMLEALGDATKEQRAELEALANTLNKKYPQTLTGIIQTGNEMLKGGFNFDQMKGALDQTLATAVLGDMAPAEVGNMMARTINSFQLPMKTYEEAMRSSQRVSDQMTFAAVKTTASLKNMGEMYRYVGGAASAAGISLEQSTALAMAFAKNGTVGSEAGVAMRSGILRLIKPVAPQLAAMGRIGMKLSDYVESRPITPQGIISGLQADGIDAGPLKKQIKGLVENFELSKDPVKLGSAITKIVQARMKGMGSAMDAKTIAQSVQDSVTSAGSKVDFFKFMVDLKKLIDTGKASNGDVASIMEGRHFSRFMALLQSNLPELLESVFKESDGYAQSRYGIVIQGIVGPVYELSAALEKLSIALGRVSFPTLAKGISFVSDSISSLSETNPILLKLAATLGLATIALGPFLIAAGATVRAVGLLARGLLFLATASTLGLAARLVAVARGITAVSVAASLGAVARLRALAAGLIALGAVGGGRAVLAALGASLLGLGRAVLMFPVVALRAIGAAMWTLVANPVGIAVTAIVAALTALGVWVYNNWEGIKTFFASFGAGFMKGLGPEASGAITKITDGLKAVWDWFAKLLGPLDESGAKWKSWGEAAGAAAASAVTALSGLPAKLGEIAKLGYDAVVNFDWSAAGRALVDKIAEGIRNGASALAGALTGAVSSAWERAKSVVGLGSSPAAPAPSTSIPGRYRGGPVSAGQPYIVGERGPEIFVPQASGRIETNGVLNGLSRSGGRAGGDGLVVGVDASAIERVGVTAKQNGAIIVAALDRTTKPLVDTSSIEAATVAAEKLKAVLSTIGAGSITLANTEGGAAAVGRAVSPSAAMLAGGSATAALGRTAAVSVDGATAAPSATRADRGGASNLARSSAMAAVGGAQAVGEDVVVNGHRYRAGAGSEEGKQRVASWLGFMRRSVDKGGLGLDSDKSRAMVAMLQGESHANLNPGALGDHRGGKPTAFGTAQWRLDRADALQSVAKQMGRPWTDVGVQQAHFRNEMLGRYRGTFDAIRAAPTGEHALAIGIDRYENPAKKALAYRFRKPYLDTLRRQEATTGPAGPSEPASAKAGKAAATGVPMVLKPNSMPNAPGETMAESVKRREREAASASGSEAVKLAGARATGGPVQAGLSYLVGERGPEIFTPGASGGISTNQALARLNDVGQLAAGGGAGDADAAVPRIAPSAATVAKLRPQEGARSVRGDTTYAPTFQITGAADAQAVARQVEMKWRDMVDRYESDQRGLLSD